MKSGRNNKLLKMIAIVLLCMIAVVASIFTTGLTRAIIELAAFGGLIWLVLAKPDIQSEN